MSALPFPSCRWAAALALATVLVACGGGKANDALRTGPQAAHPSPSALAKIPLDATIPCGGAEQPACQSAHGNDGSRPIID